MREDRVSEGKKVGGKAETAENVKGRIGFENYDLFPCKTVVIDSMRVVDMSVTGVHQFSVATLY